MLRIWGSLHSKIEHICTHYNIIVTVLLGPHSTLLLGIPWLPLSIIQSKCRRTLKEYTNKMHLKKTLVANIRPNCSHNTLPKSWWSVVTHKNLMFAYSYINCVTHTCTEAFRACLIANSSTVSWDESVESQKGKKDHKSKQSDIIYTIPQELT